MIAPIKPHQLAMLAGLLLTAAQAEATDPASEPFITQAEHAIADAGNALGISEIIFDDSTPAAGMLIIGACVVAGLPRTCQYLHGQWTHRGTPYIATMALPVQRNVLTAARPHKPQPPAELTTRGGKS